MKKVFVRIVNAYKFGGLKYMFTIGADVICHTKKRRELTTKLIEKYSKGDCQKKAAAYYSMELGRKVDLVNPRTFTEKVQWYMVNDSTELKADLTDKYKVREFVEKKLGNQCLIPLLGVWERFEQIDFDMLPEQFVLKCNHGSGMNVVIKDKANVDYDALKQQFERWMKTNFAYNNFELHYAKITPRIVAEAYIEELDGNLFDYKVHCFNGKPELIQVIGDRDLEAHTGKQLMYDFEWKKQDWGLADYPPYEGELVRPKVLDKLYEYSGILCEGFEYVRVDFYILDKKILFGEMTFTPGAGLYKYKDEFTRDVDLMLGEKIHMH